MEWDGFMDLATAAYNFVPNVTLKESPFFLMFGRDPYMPINKLLSQAMRYLCTAVKDEDKCATLHLSMVHALKS